MDRRQKLLSKEDFSGLNSMEKADYIQRVLKPWTDRGSEAFQEATDHLDRERNRTFDRLLLSPARGVFPELVWSVPLRSRTSNGGLSVVGTYTSPTGDKAFLALDVPQRFTSVTLSIYADPLTPTFVSWGESFIGALVRLATGWLPSGHPVTPAETKLMQMAREALYLRVKQMQEEN